MEPRSPVALYLAWSLALIAFVAPLQAAAEPVSRLKITNAYDAFGKRRPGLTQDFGFSAVAEYGGQTILFDAGTDARTFKGNLEALGIDPRTVDIVVLSHGHYDHVGGIDALLDVNRDVKIYAPADFAAFGAPIRFPFSEPEPDVGNSLPSQEQYFHGERSTKGMVTVPTGRFWKYDVQFVTEAREIAPGLTLIPTTSSLMGGFIKYPPADDDHPLLIGMPELSLVFATDKGDFLLSGCAHSSIEAIIRETLRVRGTRIHTVAGGFHLIPYGSEAIGQLALRMRQEYGIDTVAPAHCTGQTAFVVFRRTFGDRYRFFGLGETLSL